MMVLVGRVFVRSKGGAVLAKVRNYLSTSLSSTCNCLKEEKEEGKSVLVGGYH